MKKGLAVMSLCTLWLFGADYYMNGDKRVALEQIPAKTSKYDLGGSGLHFKKPDGQEIAIPNRLIVKFASMENFERYLQAYDLKVIKKYDFGNMFLLEAKTPRQALEAANSLYEKPDVAFAQPDIIRKWSLR